MSPASGDRAIGRRTAPILWVLCSLFALRVGGQLLVELDLASWLPGREHWMSGLLPYPYLLPSQILILAAQVVVNVQLSRRRGLLHAPPRPRIGRGIAIFAAVYAGSMVLRYAVTMARHPERRWLGEGTIPRTFHLALAAYLWLYSRHLRGEDSGGDRG